VDLGRLLGSSKVHDLIGIVIEKRLKVLHYFDLQNCLQNMKFSLFEWLKE
jgi:hypothetical protein